MSWPQCKRRRRCDIVDCGSLRIWTEIGRVWVSAFHDFRKNGDAVCRRFREIKEWMFENFCDVWQDERPERSSYEIKERNRSVRSHACCEERLNWPR